MMDLETFLLIVCTFSFLVVSVALAAKFVMDAYLEYIQVKHGIHVVTMNDMKEYLEEVENQDDDFSN
jgi:hypothetical protein